MNNISYRCTVCGRVGTVGRCCGEETREPLTDVHSEVKEIIDSLYGKKINDMYNQALDDVKQKISEYFG